MNIAGIIKSSFIDYPGFASTVIFLGGCNFRCGYCHNPEIVNCAKGSISLSDFFVFLKKRKRFVDAVCISGGEPTLHLELYELLRTIKEMGYRVKLDTNGTNPTLLGKLIEEKLVDYIAMDIKAPWEKYEEIIGIPFQDQMAKIKECLSLLRLTMQGKYELRTTVCKGLLSQKDLLRMARQLALEGKPEECWYLQTFQKRGELLGTEDYSAYGPVEMEEIRQLVEKEVQGKIGTILVR